MPIYQPISWQLFYQHTQFNTTILYFSSIFTNTCYVCLSSSDHFTTDRKINFHAKNNNNIIFPDLKAFFESSKYYFALR